MTNPNKINFVPTDIGEPQIEDRAIFTYANTEGIDPESLRPVKHNMYIEYLNDDGETCFIHVNYSRSLYGDYTMQGHAFTPIDTYERLDSVVFNTMIVSDFLRSDYLYLIVRGKGKKMINRLKRMK